jgi:hypothetical protein
MTYFFSNRISIAAAKVPKPNFLSHLESSEDKAFGASAPIAIKDVGNGHMKPQRHDYGDYSGIAKYDPQSVINEPLAHKLFAPLGVPIPQP